MNDVIVRPNDYAEKMEQLQHQLENMSEELSLTRFETEGEIFSFNDHNVTGAELNEFVEELQGHFISIKGQIKDFLQELIQAYMRMNLLNKESLDGIEVSVKSAEKASQQAKKASQQAGEVSQQAMRASQQAETASHQALQAQKDVEKTLEILAKSITHLKKFKERLDHFQHLNDVDEIWAANDRLAKSISAVKTELGKTIRDTDQRMERLEFLSGELARCKHLLEVDRIWQDVCNLSADMKLLQTESTGIKKQIEDVSEREAANNAALDAHIHRVGQMIATLQEFQNRLLDMGHLGDIDIILADVKSLSVHLEEFQTAGDDTKKQVADVSGRLAVLTERTQAEQQALVQKNAELAGKLQQAEQRTRNAYLLGGGALGVAALQLVLHLAGVL